MQSDLRTAVNTPSLNYKTLVDLEPGELAVLPTKPRWCTPRKAVISVICLMAGVLGLVLWLRVFHNGDSRSAGGGSGAMVCAKTSSYTQDFEIISGRGNGMFGNPLTITSDLSFFSTNTMYMAEVYHLKAGVYTWVDYSNYALPDALQVGASRMSADAHHQITEIINRPHHVGGIEAYWIHYNDPKHGWDFFGNFHTVQKITWDSADSEAGSQTPPTEGSYPLVTGGKFVGENETTMLLGFRRADTDFRILHFLEETDGRWVVTHTLKGVGTSLGFGAAVATSGTWMVVTQYSPAQVLVYNNYTQQDGQTINAPYADETWGTSVALSEDALTLYVGYPGLNNSQGGVFVYLRTRVNEPFSISQILKSSAKADSGFGSVMAMRGDMLMVSSSTHVDIFREHQFIQSLRWPFDETAPIIVAQYPFPAMRVQNGVDNDNTQSESDKMILMVGFPNYVDIPGSYGVIRGYSAECLN